jgi:hypothetical protein
MAKNTQRIKKKLNKVVERSNVNANVQVIRQDNYQLLVRVITNNGCRQGMHAHAHSGARVVGRDVGCGWG